MAQGIPEGITVFPDNVFHFVGCVVTSKLKPAVTDSVQGDDGYGLQLNIQMGNSGSTLQLCAIMGATKTVFLAVEVTGGTIGWQDPVLNQTVSLPNRLFDNPGEGLQIDVTQEADGSLTYQFLVSDAKGNQHIVYAATTPPNFGQMLGAGVGLVGVGTTTLGKPSQAVFTAADFMVTLNEEGSMAGFIVAPGAGNTSETGNLSAPSIKYAPVALGQSFSAEFTAPTPPAPAPSTVK